MMRYKLLLAMSLVLTAGCSKDKKDNSQETVGELLTRSEWTLHSYGFDDDSTGRIEAHENMITDCQKDNTTKFNSNGTGSFAENQLRCATDSTGNFSWKFLNNQTMLELGGFAMRIVKLDEKELILSEEAFFTTDLISTYTR